MNYVLQERYFSRKLHIIILITLLTFIQPSQSLLNVQIYNSTNNLIYPFAKKPQKFVFNCALHYSVLVEQEQDIYVKYHSPFIAIASSDSKEVDVSGAGTGQYQNGTYLAKMILMKKCLNMRAQKNFHIYLDLYFPKNIQQSSVQEEDNGGFTEFDKTTIKIPSHTYCMEQHELVSLRSFVNYGYSLICGVILSVMPTFPCQNIKIKILSVAFLVFWALVQLGMIESYRLALILWFCLMIYCRYKKFPQIGYDFHLTMQHQKALQLVKNSFISIFLTLVFTFICLAIQKPSQNEITIEGQAYTLISQPHPLFVFFTFMENLCFNMLLIQIFCGVFWLNRLRHVFYWLILALIFVNLSEYISVQREGQLLLPIIYSDSCQFRSMIFFFLMMPLGQYMDRFTTTNRTSTVMMISVILFSENYLVFSYTICIIWTVIWFLVMMHQIGYYELIQKLWIIEKVPEEIDI